MKCESFATGHRLWDGHQFNPFERTSWPLIISHINYGLFNSFAILSIFSTINLTPDIISFITAAIIIVFIMVLVLSYL